MVVVAWERVGGRCGMRRSRPRTATGVRGERRRGSGRRRGFWVIAQLGAECLGQRGEGDMTVPAQETAAFEVVETEAVFEFAVVVFDPPADLRQTHQVPQMGVGGQGGEPVVGGGGFGG